MGIIKALIVAVSLALDVFAVSVGAGMRTTNTRERLRLGAAFVVAECLMTLIGAGFGSVIQRVVGPVAGYVGFAALVAIGIYMIFEAMGEQEHGELPTTGFALMLSAVAVSLDSLGIGFSLLFIDSPFPLTISFIVAASIISTTSGFLLGGRLGAAVGERVGIYAGVILTLTGIAFAVLKFTGHG